MLLTAEEYIFYINFISLIYDDSLSFAILISLPVEVIHKVTVACRGRVEAGNYVVASIVRNSVAFDDEDSF